MDGPRQQVVDACPACGTLADVTVHEPYTRVTCPGCNEPFRSRTAFDHFVITEQIGTGGMSRVFRARDNSLQRDVALKILNKACSRDGRRAKQFEKEAEITARISHPNVVRVFSAGRDQGHFYIAMELVAGGSLEGLIREQGTMKEAAALEMAVHTVHGLKAAHDAGLIHRDIKPGNILFAEAATPKIVDFGLAIFARDSDGSGEIWATPYYVPLETLNHEPEDFRSDIYSFGATLYHALTGKPPCTSDSGSISELREIKARPVVLKPSVIRLSAETCAVLERCLAVRPADRYRDYAQFLDHLKHAQRSLRRGGNYKPWAGGRKKALPGWRRVWPAGAAVAATVAGIAVWQTSREKPGVPAAGGPPASLVTGDDPAAGSDVSTTSRFLTARDAMLAGDFGKAYQLFEELGGAEGTRQPTRNWALYNAGLCALFLGDTAAAQATYARLAENGLYSGEPEDADLAQFFDTTARWLAAEGSVPAGRIKDCPAGSTRAIGLLAGGLKNWHAGDAAGAFAFLQAFQASPFPRQASWMEGCKRLASAMLADAELIVSLPGPGVSGLNAEEADGRLALARGILNRLTASGACREKAAAAVEALSAAVAKRKDELLSAGGGGREKQITRELSMIHGRNATLASLGASFRFAEGAEKLQELQVTTPEAVSSRDAHHAVWLKAGEFLEQLSRDLARPVENVMEKDGLFVRAACTISGGMLISNPGQGAEVRTPLTKVPPSRLAELAYDIRQRASDTSDYYRRSELLYCFALRTGLNTAAADLGEALAAELHRFREQLFLLNRVEFLTGPPP